MVELARNLGRLNPFARRGPQQPRTETGPSNHVSEPHKGFFSRFRPNLDRTEKAALTSAKQVITGLVTRGVVRSMLSSAIGEGAGQATGGILAFAKPVGDVLRGKAEAKDIYKKSAFHIAGGSVSALQKEEKEKTAKSSIFRKSIKGLSRVFTAFENASTQVVYGVTRKRSAVSETATSLTHELNNQSSNSQSPDIRDSTVWQTAFRTRLQSVANQEELPKQRTRATRQLRQLSSNLSYLKSFEYGKVDVYGETGSIGHRVEHDHTPEVFTAMHQGLLGALNEINGPNKQSSKILRDLKRRAEKEDTKLLGRTVAVGALYAAAAGVKVWAFGQFNDSLHIGEMIFKGIKASGKELQHVIDYFKGSTPATSAQVADLSGAYEPIQVGRQDATSTNDATQHVSGFHQYTRTEVRIPDEDLHESASTIDTYSPVADEHIIIVSHPVHQAGLNHDSQLPDGGNYTPVEHISRVVGGITKADQLPRLDTIKTLTSDQTVWGGARNIITQLQQTDKNFLSNWPKTLNVSSIAGNEQSILTNGLQKWMSLTGHGLDLDHAQRLSNLIAEAHRQTAVLEAVGKTWNDLPSDLKTAFMLSEGLAGNVSTDDALSILGLK